MFTLKSYLKKVQEESARILKEADAVETEKKQLVKPVLARIGRKFFQDPEQVKQLNNFIKDKELPFIKAVRANIAALIRKKHRLIKLLEKSAKKELIVDIEWLWGSFKKIEAEISNIDNLVKLEKGALEKEEFKQFAEFYDMEKTAYSGIEQIISEYPKVGADIHEESKDYRILSLLKIRRSTLWRAVSMILIVAQLCISYSYLKKDIGPAIDTARSYVRRQIPIHTKPSELTVTEQVGTVYHFTQKEGERRLLELALVPGSKEDSWMFVKKKDGKYFWADIGYGIKDWHASINMGVLEQHISKGDEVTVYHIHPIDSEDLNEETYRKYMPPYTGPDYVFLNYPHHPSVTDFVTDASLRRELEKRGIIVRHSVVASCLGIFRYKAPITLESGEQLHSDFEEMGALSQDLVKKSKMQQKGYDLSFEPN